jgi:biopolymer transport protein TolR
MPKVQAIDTGAGGGRARPRRIVSTLSEINVVPLVDVMLVLLIIFMVTAPMMQRTLDVNLPQARRAEPNSDQGVYVTVALSYRKDRRVRLGDASFPVDLLAERVRQALRYRTDKNVFLQCDGALTVQDQLDVMDRLKDGGAEKVAIVAKFPERR